jgi:hypothetical protein
MLAPRSRWQPEAPQAAQALCGTLRPRRRQGTLSTCPGAAQAEHWQWHPQRPAPGAAEGVPPGQAPAGAAARGPRSHQAAACQCPSEPAHWASERRLGRRTLAAATAPGKRRVRLPIVTDRPRAADLRTGSRVRNLWTSDPVKEKIRRCARLKRRVYPRKRWPPR